MIGRITEDHDQRVATHAARRGELSLEVGDLPTVPTSDELAVLHERLNEGARSASIAARTSLFAALVEGVEVHDADDIRPTLLFRRGRSGDGLTSSSRRHGWS